MLIHYFNYVAGEVAWIRGRILDSLDPAFRRYSRQQLCKCDLITALSGFTTCTIVTAEAVAVYVLTQKMDLPITCLAKAARFIDDRLR